MNIEKGNIPVCGSVLTTIWLATILFCGGAGVLLAQEKDSELARYTPAWIEEGFADGGANHEPWIFQVRRNSEFNQWQREYYDYQTSEEYIRKIAEAGVTVYHLYLYKGFGFEAEKEHMEQAARAAAIAHRYGMKVDTYLQWNTMIYETFFSEVPEAKTDLWYQIDATGKPVMITYGFQQSFRYRPCFNHDGYMNYFKEKIIRYAVEEVRTDFLHFDNFDYNEPAEADFNPAAVKAFRQYLLEKYTPEQRIERFGFADMSYMLPPMWNNSNRAGDIVAIKDPVMQEWTDFRCHTLTTRLIECAEFARQLNKEVVIEINCGGIEGGNRAWGYGIDHGDLLQYANVIWAEDLNYANWQDGVAVGKFRNYKLGRATDTYIMSYNRTPYDFAENLALNRTIGSLGWNDLDSVQLHYLQFWHRHKDLYVNKEGAEKVAVLRSYASMAYNTRDTHVSVNMAEQALQQRQIPFALLYDQYLANLGRYSVLVLADQECLSERHVRAIKEFVSSGGGLVVTDNTGRYDDWRRLRKTDLISEMRKEVGATGLSGEAVGFTYSKGRVSYIPELIRPEGEIKLGYRTRWMMPLNSRELAAAVYWVAPERLPLTVTAPEWVGVSHDKGRREEIIHLFNYNHGKKATGVSITVKGEFRNIKAVSPDIDEEIEIKSSYTGGYTEIKVPDFRVYLILILNRK